MKREPGQRAPFTTIGTRHPTTTVDAVNADAERLGLTQSEWMRMVVDRGLKAKITPEQAARYHMTTQAEEREKARANGEVRRPGRPRKATA